MTSPRPVRICEGVTFTPARPRPAPARRRPRALSTVVTRRLQAQPVAPGAMAVLRNTAQDEAVLALLRDEQVGPAEALGRAAARFGSPSEVVAVLAASGLRPAEVVKAAGQAGIAVAVAVRALWFDCAQRPDAVLASVHRELGIAPGELCHDQV